MAKAMRLALAALAFVVASLANAAEPLFPTPLHLTRQVHDPISDTTTVLDEYAYGNRVVSVRGPRTSIADYERGELTEINREDATYSITKFEVLAKALAGGATARAMSLQSGDAGAARMQMRSSGMKATKLGRQAEFFEAEVEASPMKRTMAIAVDANTMVSKEALEVLLGAAYPNPRLAEHDAVVRAAATQNRRGDIATNALSAPQMYALPIEQSMLIELDGQKLEMRTSVVRIGTELPGADLLSIPAGARLVTSRIVAVQNELEQLDHPQTKPQTKTPDVP